MKKQLIAIAASLAASVVLATGVHADFAKSKDYTDGMFTDVPSGEWYAASVKDAYEYGIMQGDSGTTFSPNGTLTIAEGVTIAARIYENLNAKAIPDASGEWYAKYVNYAVANGFLEDGRYEDYERTIKRSEMAELLADVCGELPAINTVESLPDVGEGSSYGKKVFKLYRAGILTGNDNYGTFAPDSKLLRSEISAMAVRIALADKRVQKSFDKTAVRTLSDAYYIIDMMSENGPTGLANGWDYDYRFDLFNTSGTYRSYINDMTDTAFGSLIRKFKTERDGLLHLELYFGAFSDDGTAYVAFEDEDENKIVSITPKNGKWVLVGAEEKATTVDVPTEVSVGFKTVMDIDLDNRTAHLVLNNTDCGTVKIGDGDISRLVLGTEKKGKGYIKLYNARLSKNYALSEHFIAEGTGDAPAMWNVTGDWKLTKTESERGYDLVSVKSETKAGGTSTASRSFTPIAGKISFETMILLPEKTDGASVSLTSGGEKSITFETRDGKIYVGDNMVNDFRANVWQNLHIEADTNAGTADIYVNGKKKATITMAAKSFDGITVSFAPKTDAVMWFDDVQICNIIDHDDYPSYPQVAESKDYNIGVNVCWLWRDQHSGEGWDSVSSFPEFEPYIGYYDEGLRETADWELKWLAEHGIDFMHACWYCPSADVKEPIKKMRHSYYALHDGYMMAKYSDLVDFCIMWENNGQDCTSFEQFRDYIWNYWMEYYFSDPRYARLDNKAVLTIWNRSKFEKAFGGAEGTRKVVEFMNEELKKIGYDGLILLASTQGANPAGTYSDIKKLGYDATYGYHWGPNGYSAEHQINCNSTDLKNAHAAGSHHIPTVSIGFNDVGRNHSRDPIITKEDHLKVCQEIKKELSEMNTGTWMDNTLIVSTTNEYSEGTYVLPTQNIGFDYLENIRLTFTGDTSEHTALDVRATADQIDRVTHLYPPHRSVIRWFQFEKSDTAEDDSNLSARDLVAVRSYDMSKAEDAGKWKANHGLSSYEVKNGAITGSSAVSDYAIAAKDFEALNAASAPILHIRMKNSEKASFEIFFATAAETSMDNTKYKTAAITETDKFVDYYINMTSCSKWTGVVTGFRIDPQTKPGSFEISLIEFMNFPTEDESTTPAVEVNGTKLSFTFKIKVLDDGDYEVVGQRDEGRGFYSSLRLYHEWNRDAGKLTLKTVDEKTIVFTVGSDKVTVDGKEQALGYTFKLRDGLPVFHMKKLCDLIGWKYTMKGATIAVQAGTDEEYQMMISREPNKWDFAIDGEMEDWTLQNSSASVSGGFLHLKSSNSDPAIYHSVGYKATDYNQITVGVKLNEAVRTGGPQLFFVTAASTNYTADKCVNGKYNIEGKKDGDTVEVVFDMTSNTLYSGTITGIRFDPFGTKADVDIDYVYCTKADAAEGSKLLEVNDENQWNFADASDVLGWKSQNASELVLENGAAVATDTNGDPAITHAVSFNANDYQVCVIGVRYRKGYENQNPQFFFVTKSSPNWEAAKGVTGKYEVPAFTNEGEIVEVSFNLVNCSKWTGDVATIRFDPFAAGGKFEVAYVRFYKLEGYVPKERPKPEEIKQVTANKPTSAVITDVERLPEGIEVTSKSTGKIATTEDPDNASAKVFKVECVEKGEQYTYLNVKMQFVAGASYKVSYKLYPLKNMLGKEFSNTIIGGNFRYGTTENPSISDHTFANKSDRSSGDGWISVEETVKVPENYIANADDCFEIWGKFSEGAGVEYLVKDISITPIQ